MRIRRFFCPTKWACGTNEWKSIYLNQKYMLDQTMNEKKEFDHFILKENVLEKKEFDKQDFKIMKRLYEEAQIAYEYNFLHMRSVKFSALGLLGSISGFATQHYIFGAISGSMGILLDGYINLKSNKDTEKNLKEMEEYLKIIKSNLKN